MSATQFHVLNVKALVAAFNQEKALEGAFSVITNLRLAFVWSTIIEPPEPHNGELDGLSII